MFPRGASHLPDGRTLLFSEPSLDEHLRARLADLADIVDGWNADDLLGRTDDSLTEQIVEHDRVDSLELCEDDKYAHEAQTKRVDMQHDYRYSLPPGQRAMVPTTFQDIVVPFRGDASLLALQPSSFSLNPPAARVLGDGLVFTYQAANPDSTALTAEFESWLSKVRDGIRTANIQIAQHNASLEDQARQRISARRTRLLRDRDLTAGLQIPVHRRSGGPVNPVPLRRRTLNFPTTPAKPFEPDPVLGQEMYEAALGTIIGMRSVMERNPSTFSRLVEPALRDHLLVQLNSTFQGNAMGEVFNGSGKTDILIRVGDGNVFIGECKKWRGVAKFPEAIDQLLSYSTWRDTKAAIVLFITTRNATDVIQQAKEALFAHGSFLREGASYDATSRINVVLRAKDDERHEVQLALLPMVVPRPQSSSLEASAEA